MMEKTVGVVIPAFCPGQLFHELLRRLARQTHIPEEVVIINTIPDPRRRGAAQQTEAAELAEEFQTSFPSLTVLEVRQKDFGHGRTRNLGIGHTDTELVLCMTQDALPRDSRLVERLIRAFDDPAVAAAYARQLPGKRSSVLEAETRIFNYPASSAIKSAEDLNRLGIKTFFCSDVCAMWRRSVYDQTGGFEKNVIFNEDMILAGKMIQNGYRIAYCADAQVYHAHHYSGIRQLHRNFDLGVSQADYPEIFNMASSSREGLRFVRQTTSDLIRSGRGYLIPQFLWQSGCKYAGYQLGKRYRKLPKRLVSVLTDSPAYWEQE
ncbi:glycosyltransferase family 2 protein [Porcincola sp. LCP21S3_C12]|uniref:glycosyltransferase family 2 protein n=1 Tax=Porcincola sp. LCP21S3_C12 TaxID=3438798 RepID=UPI003F962FAD